MAIATVSGCAGHSDGPLPGAHVKRHHRPHCIQTGTFQAQEVITLNIWRCEEEATVSVPRPDRSFLARVKRNKREGSELGSTAHQYLRPAAGKWRSLRIHSWPPSRNVLLSRGSEGLARAPPLKQMFTFPDALLPELTNTRAVNSSRAPPVETDSG